MRELLGALFCVGIAFGDALILQLVLNQLVCVKRPLHLKNNSDYGAAENPEDRM